MLDALSSYRGDLCDFADGMQNLKLPHYSTKTRPRKDTCVVKFPSPQGYVLKQYEDSLPAKMQFLTMNLLADRLTKKRYTIGGASARVGAVRHHALVKIPKGVVAVIEQAPGTSLEDIAGDIIFRRENEFTSEQRRKYMHSIPLIARMAVDDTFGKTVGSLLVDDIATPPERRGYFMMQNLFVSPYDKNDEGPVDITIVDQPRLGHSLDRFKAQVGIKLLGELSAGQGML